MSTNKTTCLQILICSSDSTTFLKRCLNWASNNQFHNKLPLLNELTLRKVTNNKNEPLKSPSAVKYGIAALSGSTDNAHINGTIH